MCFKRKKKEKKNVVEQSEIRVNELNDLIQHCAYLNAQKDAEVEQQRLDFQKWIESKNKQCDMSGKMAYCSHCDFCRSGECLAKQITRVEEKLCAKAFKKYYQSQQRKENKDFKFTTKPD